MCVLFRHLVNVISTSSRATTWAPVLVMWRQLCMDLAFCYCINIWSGRIWNIVTLFRQHMKYLIFTKLAKVQKTDC